MTATATQPHASAVHVVSEAQRITAALAPRHNRTGAGWRHVILAEQVATRCGRDALADLVAAVEAQAANRPS